MIQVRRKGVFNALQYTSATHEQIKQIAQQQNAFVSESADTVTVSLEKNSNTSIVMNHNDWFVDVRDNGIFSPVKQEVFNKLFEV